MTGREQTHDTADMICVAWRQGDPSRLDARCPICRPTGRQQAATWTCRCGYMNAGAICTHCGWTW